MPSAHSVRGSRRPAPRSAPAMSVEDPENSSASSVFISRQMSNGGVQLIRPVKQRSTKQLVIDGYVTPNSEWSSNTKLNITNVGLDFVASTCLTDCWQYHSAARTAIAREALGSTNKLAAADFRASTDLSDPILAEVCIFLHAMPTKRTTDNFVFFQIAHTGSTWRLAMKITVHKNLHLWDIFPRVPLETDPDATTWTVEQKRDFTKKAVEKLLFEDSFLNFGWDRTPVSHRFDFTIRRPH